MSVDNLTTEPDASIQHKSSATNGGGDHVNGVTNGYPEKHKSSHKSSSHDKHKSKDKDKDRERSKDHKSSSSSKHSSSSSRDKDKDKHSSSKDKDRSHSHSHKSSNRDKDREKSDKDKERSSDKEKSDKERSDKEKDRSSDKDKHRSKDHKSSSRDKNGEKKESSSSVSREKSDKDKSSSSKHKSSSRDHDRDDKHSSKSKDRHHRDKDKDRSKEKSSKHRESSSKKSSSEVDTSHDVAASDNDFVLPTETCVKEEIDTYEEETKIKIEVESQDLKAQLNDSQSSCDYSYSQFKDEPKEVLPEEDPEYEIEEKLDIEVKQETEEDSEEDVPLSARLNSSKRKMESESEDDVPIAQRKKKKSEKKSKKAKKRSYEDYDDDDDDEDIKPVKTKTKTKAKVKKEKETKTQNNTTQDSPTKRKKKAEEEQEVWKWWEEEKKNDGTKWTFLEHKGPVFAPPYERLPSNIKFYYDGKEMALSEEAEEVACFYAKMLTHDYTSKPVFNENFFKDWRKTMTEKEKSTIRDLTKCDFRKMNAYFTDISEKNKQRSKEEKLKIKEQNEAIIKEYGFCKIDGHMEKIGNFRIEPPGLFRGRGEHPKMGMVKKRVLPEHVMLNCSKDSVIPVAPKGHKWKEVRHDNTVTWLASWTENVQGQVKYIMLNPSSKLKGEKDWQKYETARKLAKCIKKIRETYTQEWKAKEMKVRQRAVALYFIDRLALRAGNEKDEDQADTVGCCSLRVEHIELHKEKDGKEYVVVFDFLGKDSIRYYNEVPVEKRVFKNLELFKENKKEGDDLFDRLNTSVMNDHLRDLMEGLTAKVFRTYNASITLQNQLKELTDPDATLPEKILAYNRANRAVAILCNHQRAVPKSHDKSMSNLREKMNQKREQIEEMEQQVRDAAKDAKRGSVKEKMIHEKKSKGLEKLREQLKRMEVQETDRDENKTIALGTSKLNYLDPRISVAWCKKFGVPLEKIYNKTQRDKFRWAIDMATEEYIF